MVLSRDQVHVFDATTGGERTVFGGTGSAPGQLLDAQGMAWDYPVLKEHDNKCDDKENKHQGRLFVADTGNHRIQVFHGSGELVAAWSTRKAKQHPLASGRAGRTGGEGEGEQEDIVEGESVPDDDCQWPHSLAITGGHVWVADGHDRVHVFTLSGKHLCSAGQAGLGSNCYDRLSGMAPRLRFGPGDGKQWQWDVLLADQNNNRVQVAECCMPGQTRGRRARGEGSNTQSSLRPYAHSYGQPYSHSLIGAYSGFPPGRGGSYLDRNVGSDNNNTTNLEVTIRWKFAHIPGEHGVHHCPSALATHEQDLWILDSVNGCLDLFALTNVSPTWVRTLATDLTGARALAIDSGAGLVYVADTTRNRVLVFPWKCSTSDVPCK